MTTWLVTGASGFLGRHLLAAIRRGGDQAVGLDHPRTTDEDVYRVDLETGAGLGEVLAEVRPELVIHAAGRTPPASTLDYYRGNVLTTTRLLEAVASREKPPRVVLIGSAAEIGPLPESLLPAPESCPCRPVDAYGLSKWSASQLGLMAPAPLEVVVGRIFNLNGPGLPRGQAFGRFAAALAHAQIHESAHQVTRLDVGGLEARRDFVDVRDAAAALIALGREGRPGTLYHIGTGQSHAIGEGLKILTDLAGQQVETSIHPHARAGVSDSRAEITRIYQHTGWRPRIEFATSLADLWTEALRQAVADPRRVA